MGAGFIEGRGASFSASPDSNTHPFSAGYKMRFVRSNAFSSSRCTGGSSSARNTSSVPPTRILSPCCNTFSRTGTPFTKLPFRLLKSIKR